MNAIAVEATAMSASIREVPSGLHAVQLADGTRIELAQLTNVEDGRRLLDDLDAEIVSIEDQLREAGAGRRPSTWAWRRSADLALRYKKLMRPRLQERIAELKHAEKVTAATAAARTYAALINAKRDAFVKAAYELLGHEACTEVWARAAELAPTAFSDGIDGVRS